MRLLVCSKSFWALKKSQSFFIPWIKKGAGIMAFSGVSRSFWLPLWEAVLKILFPWVQTWSPFSNTTFPPHPGSAARTRHPVGGSSSLDAWLCPADCALDQAQKGGNQTDTACPLPAAEPFPATLPCYYLMMNTLFRHISMRTTFNTCLNTCLNICLLMSS